MFSNRVAKKDKNSWLKVFSGICGNLAAGWYGLVIFSGAVNPEDFPRLTREIILGIFFTWLAYYLDRHSR